MKKTSKPTARSRRSSAALPPAVAEVLTAFARVAARQGLRWYVFGAQAVAIHGVVRTSADADVTVEVPARRVPALVKALVAEGFAPRLAGDPVFVAVSRVLPFVHEATEFPLDVVLAGSGLEDGFLERARPFDLGGVTVPLIAPEDLVVTKILAGRPKDLEDVRGLLRLRGRKLDLGRVRALLTEIQDALDQADLLPILDGLLAERRRPR